MWVPSKIIEWFGLNAEIVRDMQAELAVARAERDALRVQLGVAQNSFEWIRVRVNQLEAERNGLLEKAYGIKLPAPEILRTSNIDMNQQHLSFEDVGNEWAKKLGYPLYDEPSTDNN